MTNSFHKYHYFPCDDLKVFIITSKECHTNTDATNKCNKRTSPMRLELILK